MTISESLDSYGWATDDEKRRMALFSWMQATTREIERLRADVDMIAQFTKEHEAHLLKLAELQQEVIDAAQKDADNLDRVIQLLKGK